MAVECNIKYRTDSSLARLGIMFFFYSGKENIAMFSLPDDHQCMGLRSTLMIIILNALFCCLVLRYL